MDHNSDCKTASYLKLPCYKEEKNIKISDFPNFVLGTKFLSNNASKVYESLLRTGLSWTYRSCTYVFIPMYCSWMPVRTIASYKLICEILTLNSVAVNFHIACGMYADFLERCSPRCREVPTSVCINTWRFLVSKMEDGVIYKPVYNVVMVPNRRKYPARTGSFAYKPVFLRVVPDGFLRDDKGYVESMFLNVMDPKTMEVLKWVIGNALIDPVEGSKVVLLYGTGGNGKSMTINVLMEVLKGVMEPLSIDYASGSKRVEESDLFTIVSNRIVCFGDVRFGGRPVNESYWKLVTGGDSIRVGSNVSKLEATCIMGSNDLFFPTSTMLEPWFSRRTIVLDLHKPTKSEYVPKQDYDEVDRITFVNSCIYTRLNISRVPLTPQIALRSILGLRAAASTRGIVFDDNSGWAECIAATHSISDSSCVRYSTLIELLECMDANLIGCFITIKYLRGISLRCTASIKEDYTT